MQPFQSPSLRILAVCVLAVATAGAQANKDSERIRITLDTSEAEAALSILEKQAAQQDISEGDWKKLFSSEPYARLKQREAAFHRDFTDEDFRKFLLSPDLAKKSPSLRQTLTAWQKADLVAAARHVLPYLPAQAHIYAKVYPVIKPRSNSFVFDLETGPAIFLYLDPTISEEEFENTVAHEMHHIGFSSVAQSGEAAAKSLPEGVQTALDWSSALGEGFAMLAAAGSPDVHPHASSKNEDRERWDRDMAHFNEDLKTLDQFFLDIIHGKFQSKEEMDKVGYSFFGVQGPWYTVGYKMAVTIEKRYGRATLVECMADRRRLFPTYNRAAAEQNATGGGNLALFSPELIQAVEIKP